MSTGQLADIRPSEVGEAAEYEQIPDLFQSLLAHRCLIIHQLVDLFLTNVNRLIMSLLEIGPERLIVKLCIEALTRSPIQKHPEELNVLVNGTVLHAHCPIRHGLFLEGIPPIC